MNKTAIKNFAIWARNKLIDDITYKSGLLGISEKGIKDPLPQSSSDVQFFDIGAKEPYPVTGVEIEQRRNLVELIRNKEKHSDYKTAYHSVIEEVAYTWFNRLIAVRFMEVNDYLPSRIRVLSSVSVNKIEPDIVTTPFDAELDYSPDERDQIMQLKLNNKLDELFRMLFIKQCNALNAILPELFEKTDDYTELLLNVSFTDKDGVVHRLVHDIPEDDFNVEKEGQVEIIGWLYQYYNDERKEQVININKGVVHKNDIPAATQLFTTNWVVRYMIDNSLGRYWLERNPGSRLKGKLEYLVDSNIIPFDESIFPEDIKILDPCMGSGHVLVYAFDVLMAIYEEQGYSQRDAARKIIEKNLYGLDIDHRAYQLAYFAVLMKARQYNRRLLNDVTRCHLYFIEESNGINREHLHFFGFDMEESERSTALKQLEYLIDKMKDAKEYGSLIEIKQLNWDLIIRFIHSIDGNGQVTLDSIGLEDTQKQLSQLIHSSAIMAQSYDIVATNPPYLNKYDKNLKDFITKNYKDYSGDLFSVFIFRNFSFCKPHGYTAFMSPYVWLFIKTYQKLREFVIIDKSISSLIQMEYSAFEEATVPICAFVLKNARENGNGAYIRLSSFKGGMDVQRKKVLQAISDKKCGYYYQTPSSNFLKIPGMPIAYWLEKIDVFKYPKLHNFMFSGGRNKTHDNQKYVRNWWETCKDNKRWVPYANGGEYRKWYGNHMDTVDWSEDAKAYYNLHGGLCREEYWGKEGITWGAITSSKNGYRIKMSEFMYSSASPTIFNEHYFCDLTVLGFLNTKPAEYLSHIINPTLNQNVNNTLDLPFFCPESSKQYVSNIVSQNIEISKCDWDSFETSPDFNRHPFLSYRTAGTNQLNLAYYEWGKFTVGQFSKLKSNEEELNRVFIEIYGLQDELTPEIEDKDITIRKADLGRDIRSFLSYAVGCMFGRYSLDVDGLAYAGGEWDDSKHTTFIPDKDNVIPITDEEYFEDDIVGLFCAFLKKTFGADTLEENLDFIAKALGNKGNTPREVIRNYFLKDFFKDHCKVYQKRPIYWLFDSGRENGFKALVYLHRYNADTIGNLRIDYLHRMQRVYESEIARMQETIENSTNAREKTAATKRKEKLTKQLKETKEYDEKIAHLALARIAIDLDDGVKVNYDKVQTDTDGNKLDVLAKI